MRGIPGGILAFKELQNLTQPEESAEPMKRRIKKDLGTVVLKATDMASTNIHGGEICPRKASFLVSFSITAA